MDINKNWLKFVISGRAEDYVRYSCACRLQKIDGGETGGYYNGRACNKGGELRGKGQTSDPADT